MKRFVGVLLVTLVALCLPVNQVHAVPIIDFVGGSGGTVTYAGGANPLIGTNNPVNSVFGDPPGVSSDVSVSSGLMNYQTGNFLSGFLSSGILYETFDAGGSINITGGVPAAGIPNGSLLMGGSFLAPSTITCCSGGTGSFGGLLDVTTINPDLAAYFGFAPPSTGGSIAQTEVNIRFRNGGRPYPGRKFGGVQSSVDVSSEVSAIPEPATLMLLGSGLAGLGIWARKRKNG